MFNIYADYFFGNKISDYGIENKRVDYGTLAKAFDAVLNNDFMNNMYAAGYEWEMVSGMVDNSERIEELETDIEELRGDAEELRGRAYDLSDAGDISGCDELENKANDILDRVRELEEEKEELEREQDELPEVFQWYIVSDAGARILEECNEILYYCEPLDVYLWGVTHYGTAWSYVLTNIPCMTGVC